MSERPKQSFVPLQGQGRLGRSLERIACGIVVTRGRGPT